MSGPRFLFTARVVPAGREGTARLAWRLVGGNNHELGRSRAAYASFPDCIEAVRRLQGAVDDLVAEPVGSDNGAHHGWQVRLDGVVVAVSGRWYRRERESDYNLAHFLAAVPLATVAGSVGGPPPRRDLLRPHFVLPPTPAPAPLETIDGIGRGGDEFDVTQDIPVEVVDELDDFVTGLPGDPTSTPTAPDALNEAS